MPRFTARVTRDIEVEVEMPDGFAFNDDDGNETYVDVEQFMDAVNAAVPGGIVHHQQVSAWDERGTQVL